MNRIDWIKAKALLLPLKHEYKENFHDNSELAKLLGVELGEQNNEKL